MKVKEGYYNPRLSYAFGSTWAFFIFQFPNADGTKREREIVHFLDEMVHHHPIRSCDNEENGSADSSQEMESEHV